MKILASNKWILLLPLLLAPACNREELPDVQDTVEWHEQKIAVVLPMGYGLEAHWKRTLQWASENILAAQGRQAGGVSLVYEWYDEEEADLDVLVRSLATREDITAVIGGLYSSNAQKIAVQCARTRKPFFTLATTEQLIRGYSGSGFLWAMTETDITQCEVLLAKALYYGAERVALLAKRDDLYGQTFIDWFGFQANELGLTVCGIHAYESGTVADRYREAAAAQPDYIICAMSETVELQELLQAQHAYALETGRAPRLLFSDTGYGTDVLAQTGLGAEGMEGVCFGADPEAGFDISYEVFFSEKVSVGEAQLYDAAMLIAYAAFRRMRHPGEDLNLNLRHVVDGREPAPGGWQEKDMERVFNALSGEVYPDIRGASGSLDFDARVYTNVLNTTYYNYKVYNGEYIILDYNTSDGGKRTDATLAGWNRKAALMQDFDEVTVAFPPLREKWALLVAASSGWLNYRHQADVLAMYQLLKQQGYADDHIVLVAEDDIAFNAKNTSPGTVQVQIGGANVYKAVEIDYKLSELQLEDITAILNGEKSERLPHVLESASNDNVLFFWSGHGLPGEWRWKEDPQGVTAEFARTAFVRMSSEQRYRKLLCLIETCYSGSVAQACEGIPGLLFITAANASETSKADIFSDELGVWMSNRFTSTLLEQLNASPQISLRDLYYRLFINTVGSHVMVYNARNFGNIYNNTMEEFL
ncbi:MAG: ABC transporter substrate-binding protein [Tannerella sp.]|jgi:ABC-type branched-subunit amino acid transport system substrate-binding protein|nr:ABC transporter substrate-binding protein [Tannerella sp.]